MIHICEVYAEEFKICFNGTKSKLMVYGMDVNDVICVRVSGEDVECVNRMDYLGHTITNDRSGSLVDAVSTDFDIKFNSFISDFGKIHIDVKNN